MKDIPGRQLMFVKKTYRKEYNARGFYVCVTFVYKCNCKEDF